MEEEHSLGDLKVKYAEFQKKYDLPNFDDLNKDFQVEKISDCETDFLIREVRKLLGEKISNYLRFVETLLHPVNVPMFVFSMIKAVDEEDKKRLTEIYKKLAKVEISFIEADLEFSEEKEVNFIRNSYEVWQGVKKDLASFIQKVKGDWDKTLDINGGGKNYFG